nr:uncharacterized protein LOC111387306 [Ipomoea batatas]
MDCSMLNLHDNGVREEEEETISLSDFPANGDESGERIETRIGSRSSSEVFEFLSDLTCEMSHADDIIFCGKLVPLRDRPVSAIHGEKFFAGDGFRHRRCESLSELGSTPRTNSGKSERGRGHVRSSRSLDSGKFRSGSSSSEAAAGKGDSPRLKIQKPRWFVLMFGNVKLPREMELRDIKNRQVRQNVPLCRMFPSPESCSSASPVRRSHRRSSWDLLKVLSCNDPASVAVTTSFRCMSQA